MSLIVSNPFELFVGDERDASEYADRYDLIITAGGDPNFNSEKVERCIINISDTEDADLFGILPIVLDSIDRQLRNKPNSKIRVH